MNLFNMRLSHFLQKYSTHILLSILLCVALWFRVYRIDQVLGFYFDQGRDANVILDLLQFHKFFLIGPTTGIAGIFRGPFYYYLITPAYFLGNGNPLYPSVFLSLLTVFALYIFYRLAKHVSLSSGFIVVALGAISFNIVIASRWLSNPTPMFILSALLLFSLYNITKGKRWYWIVVSFVSGSSLFHFGSSGELFYFPAIFLFLIWQWKYRPTIKILFFSIFAFFSTFAPQLFFDLRHEGILRKNILEFLVGKQSFKASFWEVFTIRSQFYFDVFINKIFQSRSTLENFFLLIYGVGYLVLLPKLWKYPIFKICLLFLASLYFGLLFFQGNEGNIYDYYLTGYYLIFLLSFSLGLGLMWKYWFGKLFVLFFFFLFFQNNIPVTISRLSDGLTGPETIAFGNQKQALDWIYADAKGAPFSVDVYVPPVIPHAYTYLFRWYGGKVKGYEPSTALVSPLYTLYEVDPPHPERLTAWLARQHGIGEVQSVQRFGGIVVERRVRL